VTFLRLATRASTERSVDRASRKARRTSHRYARAELSADQRRTWADRRAGEEVDRRLPDRTLGHPRPDVVTARHDRLSAAVTEEVAAGANVHRRLPFAARAIPPVVAVMDSVVLFSLCADVFDVQDTDPLSVAALASVMLALLGSGVAYVWLTLTGLRVRSYRTGIGEVEWRAIGATTRCMLAVSLIVTAVLAALMFLRVSSFLRVSGEVADSWLGTDRAALIGALFAVLSAVANLTVVAVHALDGSEVAAELRHTGRLLSRRERRVSRRLRATQRHAQRQDRIALRAQQHAELSGGSVATPTQR
jgi:hypothetical protein